MHEQQYGLGELLEGYYQDSGTKDLGVSLYVKTFKGKNKLNVCSIILPASVAVILWYIQSKKWQMYKLVLEILQGQKVSLSIDGYFSV